jgi:CheY-specific phosphatase CheX
MPEQAIDSLLDSCVESVLETMFFTGFQEVSSAVACEPGPTARITFTGDRNGAFHMQLSSTVARSVAASFLGTGEDDNLSDAEVREVVCELANMICGSVLSLVESGTAFSLSAPELTPEAVPPAVTAEPRAGVNPIQRTYDLGCGALSVTLEMEGL